MCTTAEVSPLEPVPVSDPVGPPTSSARADTPVAVHVSLCRPKLALGLNRSATHSPVGRRRRSDLRLKGRRQMPISEAAWTLNVDALDVESEGGAVAISERGEVDSLGGVHLDKRPHAERCQILAP